MCIPLVFPLTCNLYFDCVRLCFTFLQQRGHLETASNLLFLAKDVKIGKYTVPTGNRTPGRRVAVHYASAALYFETDLPSKGRCACIDLLIIMRIYLYV